MEINSVFDAVVECCSALDTMKNNPEVSKDDVIDSVKTRMHVLMRRVVNKSFFPFVSLGAWEVTNE